jgi:hypothetical protein
VEFIGTPQSWDDHYHTTRNPNSGWEDYGNGGPITGDPYKFYGHYDVPVWFKFTFWAFCHKLSEPDWTRLDFSIFIVSLLYPDSISKCVVACSLRCLKNPEYLFWLDYHFQGLMWSNWSNQWYRSPKKLWIGIPSNIRFYDIYQAFFWCLVTVTLL